MSSKKKKVTKKRKISKKELRRRAIKGWKTRYELYGPSGRKSYEKIAATSKEEELRKRISELEQRTELLEKLSTFVDDSDWMRRDGTLSRNPSTLRHLGDPTDIILETLRKSYYVDGDKELGIQGDLSLWYDQAEFYAERLDVDVREVYTLFFSP